MNTKPVAGKFVVENELLQAMSMHTTSNNHLMITSADFNL